MVNDRRTTRAAPGARAVAFICLFRPRTLLWRKPRRFTPSAAYRSDPAAATSAPEGPRAPRWYATSVDSPPAASAEILRRRRSEVRYDAACAGVTDVRAGRAGQPAPALPQCIIRTTSTTARARGIDFHVAALHRRQVALSAAKRHARRSAFCGTARRRARSKREVSTLVSTGPHQRRPCPSGGAPGTAGIGGPRSHAERTGAMASTAVRRAASRRCAVGGRLDIRETSSVARRLLSPEERRRPARTRVLRPRQPQAPDVIPP